MHLFLFSVRPRARTAGFAAFATATPTSRGWDGGGGDGLDVYHAAFAKVSPLDVDNQDSARWSETDFLDKIVGAVFTQELVVKAPQIDRVVIPTDADVVVVGRVVDVNLESRHAALKRDEPDHNVLDHIAVVMSYLAVVYTLCVFHCQYLSLHIL